MAGRVDQQRGWEGGEESGAGNFVNGVRKGGVSGMENERRNKYEKGGEEGTYISNLKEKRKVYYCVGRKSGYWLENKKIVCGEKHQQESRH